MILIGIKNNQNYCKLSNGQVMYLMDNYEVNWDTIVKKKNEFIDDVVIEESICFWRWCCSKTKYLSSRKIIKNCTPFTIDRTMAFVNDDKLEIIRW